MKTFAQYIEEKINESVTFSIQDYSPNNPVKDLYDLSVKINNQLMKNIGEDYKTGDMKYIYDKFTVDGDYLGAKEGVLNFYSGGMAEPIVQKCIQAIKYFLGNYGASLSDSIVKEKSKLYKIDVYRFPVILQNNEDIAPEINVANMAAAIIVKGIFQSEKDAYVGSMSVDEILFKLGSLTDFAIQQLQIGSEEEHGNGPHFYSQGFDVNRIKRYVDALTKIAQWAKKNGYDTIRWS